MTSLPPPTTAPAGWYPDPTGNGLRYFDGRAWGPPPIIGVPAFEPRPPHPTLPVRAALGSLVILLASLVVGRSLASLVAVDDDVLAVVLSVAIGYGPSLVWCWYVMQRYAAGKPSRVGWSFRWGDLWRGPVTYLAVLGIQVAVAAVLLLLDVPIASNVEDASDSRTDRTYIAAIVLMAVIAAPVVEEIIFRGVVLRGFLTPLHPALAIGLQGVLFGAAHIDPGHGAGNIGLTIVLSSVGAAFGAAAYLTRRIGPTVIAHAIFNGVVMVIVLTGVLDDIDRDLTLGLVFGVIGHR